MNDLMREQMFAQWLISKILALYMTQDSFREEVDSKVNDGYTFSIDGEKMSNFEQTEWKLHMVCVNIAKQLTEYYFNDFMVDDNEQTDCETCKWGEWYRNGRDITTMDDECGGCCSWDNKWQPKEPQTEDYDFRDEQEYNDRWGTDCGWK